MGVQHDCASAVPSGSHSIVPHAPGSCARGGVVMTAEPQPTAASNMSCRVTKEDDAAGVGDTRATEKVKFQPAGSKSG